MRLIDADKAIEDIGDNIYAGSKIRRWLKSLPSVQPERKTGRWIYGEDDGQDGWYCSECNGFIPWDYEFYGLDNIDFIRDFKTCPFCDTKMITYTGADMRGEQE